MGFVEEVIQQHRDGKMKITANMAKALEIIKQLQEEVAAAIESYEREADLNVKLQAELGQSRGRHDASCHDLLQNIDGLEKEKAELQTQLDNIKKKYITLAELSLEVSRLMENCACSYRKQLKIRAEQALQKGEG